MISHLDTAKNRAVSASNLDVSLCDVSVIIVNYNVREFLRQCLLSLRRASASLWAEIFVVDNASNDGSVEMARREFPEVQLISNRENVGFAAANNQALPRARGRFIVLLNPDTVVQEDTLTAIRAFFDKHRETGMVGCKVLNPDGTLQLACRRSFPTPWVAFTRLSGLSQLFPKSRWFGRYNLTYLPEDETVEVEAISGSFMAVRREALAQVGWLDEDFFLYGEDLDWCFRMRQSGWKIHYFSGTQIIHFKGESAKQSDLDNLRLFYQAMGLFVRKHFRQRLARVVYWLLHLAIWIRAAIAFTQSLVRKSAVPLLDLALMQLSMLVAVGFRFEGLEVLPSFFIVDVVYSLIWLICLALFGCYRQSTYSFNQAFAATSIGFFINASLTFFFRQYAFSRAVVLIAGFMNILLLSSWRFFAKVLHHRGWARVSLAFAPGKVQANYPLGYARQRFHRAGYRTVVVGDFPAEGALIEKLKSSIDTANTLSGAKALTECDLVGLVSLNADEVGKYYAGLPVLTSLEHFDAWLDPDQPASDRRIQQVIFSSQRIPFGRMLKIMSRPRISFNDIKGKSGRLSFKLVPSGLDIVISKSALDQIADGPLIEIENRLLRFWPAGGKRILDVMLAGFLLIVGAPFFLLLWLFRGKLESRVIGLPKAAAFFSRNNKETSELRLWQLSQRSGLKKNKEMSKLAKWPWLFAILAGKLSWVGLPIPIADNETERISADAAVLPLGVVDLTAIHRRRQLTPEEKNKLYLYYVTHYSPLLDLEILLRFVFQI